MYVLEALEVSDTIIIIREPALKFQKVLIQIAWAITVIAQLAAPGSGVFAFHIRNKSEVEKQFELAFSLVAALIDFFSWRNVSKGLENKLVLIHVLLLYTCLAIPTLSHLSLRFASWLR